MKSHQWILGYLPHFSENCRLVEKGHDRHPWLDFSLCKTEGFCVSVAPAPAHNLFKRCRILACKITHFEGALSLILYAKGPVISHKITS